MYLSQYATVKKSFSRCKKVKAFFGESKDPELPSVTLNFGCTVLPAPPAITVTSIAGNRNVFPASAPMPPSSFLLVLGPFPPPPLESAVWLFPAIRK